MTALLPVLGAIAVALCAALVLVGGGIAWHHCDRLRERNDRLTRRAKAAENRVALLEATVAERDHQLADAYAQVDEVLAHEERHLAQCPWVHADPLQAERN